MFARLEPHEQLSVAARALDTLPPDHVSALVAEQLEALSPEDVLELMLTSLRAGTGHFGVLQAVLMELPPRKMVEFIDCVVETWNGEGASFAITLFNGLSTDDRLAVRAALRPDAAGAAGAALPRMRAAGCRENGPRLRAGVRCWQSVAAWPLVRSKQAPRMVARMSRTPSE